MKRSNALQFLAKVAAVAAAYFAAGWLGLQLANARSVAAPIWPSAGIALAALLVFGYEVWPGILAGSFFLGLVTPGSLAASSVIAVGSTLAVLTSWYLLKRFARGREALDRVKDVFRFALCAAGGAVVSATTAVLTLGLTDSVGSSGYLPLWLNWWLGATAAAIVVAPPILLWFENPKVKWTREQAFELVLLGVALCATAFLVFGGLLRPESTAHSLEYLCLPFLVWAAFRFGRREAATALFLVVAIATGGTGHALGLFSSASQDLSLLSLHLFATFLGITILLLATEIFQRRRAEEQAQTLAVVDPLTGLGNYRHMVDALELEIKRFGRTERPFVVLLIDLDGLKKINEAQGYLTGSRALCRLADMLRLYSREMDTAARFGGDEFALVLPETDWETARLVAQRISKRLAEDGEEPKLSVSIGAAVCPEDGETIHEILNAADRDLYREKGVPKRKFVLPS